MTHEIEPPIVTISPEEMRALDDRLNHLTNSTEFLSCIDEVLNEHLLMRSKNPALDYRAQVKSFVDGARARLKRLGVDYVDAFDHRYLHDYSGIDHLRGGPSCPTCFKGLFAFCSSPERLKAYHDTVAELRTPYPDLISGAELFDLWDGHALGYGHTLLAKAGVLQPSIQAYAEEIGPARLTGPGIGGTVEPGASATLSPAGREEASSASRLAGAETPPHPDRPSVTHPSAPETVRGGAGAGAQRSFADRLLRKGTGEIHGGKVAALGALGLTGGWAVYELLRREKKDKAQEPRNP